MQSRVSLKVRLLSMGAAFALPICFATPAIAAPDFPAGSSSSLISTALAEDIQMVRYDAEPAETSLGISRRLFNEAADTVYIVNPAEPDLPVAIAAAPKSQRPGPVLFTEEDGTLGERALEEIARLRPAEVVVVGAGVSGEVAEAAREFASASRANAGSDPAGVEIQWWNGGSMEETSATIALGIYREDVRRVYVVDAQHKDATALAALAGTIGNGPVLAVSKDRSSFAKDAIAQLDPRFVVAVGKVDPKLLSDISGGARKSSLAGSVAAVAKNVASLGEAKETSVSVVAPLDRPALMMLASGLATGPFIPMAPKATQAQAADAVVSAYRLAGSSNGEKASAPKRFLAVGPAGSADFLFKPADRKSGRK
ncbi:MAG: hypothetical protein Q4E01_00035 [Actinomycetaceae bacterium]|nr:hypothetical protein [Actinomycetaceae bacterium]